MTAVQEKKTEKKRIVAILVETPDASWTLTQIVTKRCPPSWEKFFLDEGTLSLVGHADKFLSRPEQKQLGFYPHNYDVFRAFSVTPCDQVRVVWMGQDPYTDSHESGETCRAQGLSFSVASHDSTPSSMLNIIKEIRQTYGEDCIKGPGNLTGWASQGVLLLNAALTVSPGEPASHLKKAVWEGFLKKLLKFLASARSGCIYVFIGSWNGYTKDVEKWIDPKGKILNYPHPSGRNRTKPFLGCGAFKEINQALVAKKETPIDWTVY